MRDLWMQDIMMQKFLDSDSTRIILLYALTSSNEIQPVYKKRNILEYIYRTYSDNSQLASVNPNAKIRNIKRYGLSDIKGILEQALDEWKTYAQNQILFSDDRYIYISIEENNDNKALAKYTLQVTKMLQKKYFSMIFDTPHQLDLDVCKKDSDIEKFGKSLYRNRVFEDIQYCPLCEETNIENLVAVHILPAEYCQLDEEIVDKNNGLIMCREHANDYLQKKFVFKENGFVENIGSQIVDNYMHLSLEVKNKKRRTYIKRTYELMHDNQKK